MACPVDTTKTWLLAAGVLSVAALFSIVYVCLGALVCKLFFIFQGWLLGWQK
jgi:hypothetical protein